MIAIIDYGLGNVSAFINSYNLLGLPACLASRPSDLQLATHIILPGVGSFDGAIEKLTSRGMLTDLTRMVMEDRVPVLGVCVGMQILTERSEEGELSGLAWIKGEVERIKSTSEDALLPLPHMGWSPSIDTLRGPLFEGIRSEDEFYYLHSFVVAPENPQLVISEVEYGRRLVSGIGKQNIHGVQFHPEKSHSQGLRLLKNFGML